MRRVYNYALTTDTKYWKRKFQKINRKFTKNDRKVLKKAESEKEDNDLISNIASSGASVGCYIPELTDFDGNCFFESLQINGFCHDKKKLRQNLAFLFFLFGDSTDMIKIKGPDGRDLTLKEVCAQFNNIEYVFCWKKKRLYKYSYYTMCSDLYTNKTYTRFPTQVLLIMLSFFFGVRFHIHYDNGFINSEVAESSRDVIPKDDPERNIHLGLLGEYHYVPLCHLPDGILAEDIPVPKYNIDIAKFHKWARKVSDRAGMYVDIEEDGDDEDFYDIKNELDLESEWEESKYSDNDSSDNSKKSNISQISHVSGSNDQKYSKSKKSPDTLVMKEVNPAERYDEVYDNMVINSIEQPKTRLSVKLKENDNYGKVSKKNNTQNKSSDPMSNFVFF